MSGNFLPGFTTYQSVTPQDKSAVEILTFGAWALGRFANIKELRAALQDTKVWSDPSLATGPTPPLASFRLHRPQRRRHRRGICRWRGAHP